ncbi:MAG: aromatic amino acid lyase, partial [Cloacibacillus sp.]
MNTYYIDGKTLTLDAIRKITADADAQVLLAEPAAAACRASREQVERWMQKDAPVVYGVNTGLGNLKDVVVPPEQHIEWNKDLPYPHAAGMGEYLPAQVTLTSLLLRANVLARGYSGVRTELIGRILSVYNAKAAPAVHSEGSTGLSDLGP